MIKSRDLFAASLGVAATLGVMTFAQSEQPIMRSAIFDWNEVPVKHEEVRSVRQFFQAPTATLDELELHVSTLQPGDTSHAPHRHVNEELVIVKGGTGAVTAKSIMGEVIVEGARGRVTASSVNESVRVASSSGDIFAESSNGHITLSQITSENVDVSTINGNVAFDGSPAARGRYRFATHNGNITIGVPESSNVTFTVRTYQGRFTSSLNLTGPPRSEVRQGRRTTYTLGNGSAEMELESFGGAIRIGPPGTTKK